MRPSFALVAARLIGSVRRTTQAYDPDIMRDCWPDLQRGVTGCSLCRIEFPDANVECPPGLLYPPGCEPRDSTRVLFVGVAPPKTGRHFYTDPTDNLRRGLFDVLRQLGRQCRDLTDFIERGFFLVHTAKCAIHGTTKPNLRVSKLCSSTHLYQEIECLAPDGLCFLSKNVGFPVSAGLLPRWGPAQPVPFGELVQVTVGKKSVHAISTTWLGREVHKPLAKAHLEVLFNSLGLPTWS